MSWRRRPGCSCAAFRGSSLTKFRPKGAPRTSRGWSWAAPSPVRGRVPGPGAGHRPRAPVLPCRRRLRLRTLLRRHHLARVASAPRWTTPSRSSGPTTKTPDAAPIRSSRTRTASWWASPGPSGSCPSMPEGRRHSLRSRPSPPFPPRPAVPGALAGCARPSSRSESPAPRGSRASRRRRWRGSGSPVWKSLPFPRLRRSLTRPPPPARESCPAVSSLPRTSGRT